VDADLYRRNVPRPTEPFTVGYLSSITPRKGLQLLIDAVGRLVRDEGRSLRLRVAGKALDARYWRRARRSAAALGLGEHFEYLGELSTEDKVRFLHSCSVFVQPSVSPEPRGMTVLEAMAAGVPVIASDEGVFPESIGLCGGGLTFRARNAEDLAARLAQLMDEPEIADRLGEAGAAGVREHYSQQASAGTMMKLLGGIMAGGEG
ncbi:MAG: glycosyltransferase family 4 protein, partial [Armatimonadetes bacterium]|nr:glycosyltransferase family 4 protein [Armatimonadota bacterium]